MLEIGEVLDGKYKILDQIGQGGMSAVYLAINEKANKTWAVKEIRRDGEWEEGFVQERLLAETELLKKLQHPHLPSIVDVIERQGSSLIVMDYVEGISLEQLLQEEGAQPQEQVVRWGIQLCKVLGYLHRQKPAIIYRDMKPSNVMLQPDGNVKLIDFGTAREWKEEESQEDTVCLGTPGYAAPEQWGGCGQTDERTDLYCLGMTLFHLVTGHHPAENPKETSGICQWNPSLSTGLETILQICTRRDPNQRYQSCEALLYDLEHYSEMDLAYRNAQKRKLRVFFAALGCLVLFGGVSLGAWGKARQLQKDTYEVWMEQAVSAVSKEERLDAYRHAICLEPEQAEGYLEVLTRELLQADEDACIRFSKEEATWVQELLETEVREGESLEQRLKEKPAEYGQVAYALGLAYYYDYEGEGNKPYAVKWLQNARDCEALPVQKRERAKRLCAIAKYYAQIGQANKAGDLLISYETYWAELDTLTQGNLVELDNAVTALRMYQECVTQIYMRAEAFLRFGIEKEKLLEKLEDIRLHLRADFMESDLQALEMDDFRERLQVQVEKAKEQVEGADAYQKRKEGEKGWSMQSV